MRIHPGWNVANLLVCTAALTLSCAPELATDRGTLADAGDRADDGGVANEGDAGDARADAGAPEVDAGASEVDAGMNVDSGNPDGPDAGATTVDGGSFDPDGGFFVRNAAAKTTAETAAACVKVKPFYWEVGDQDGPKAWGSISTTKSYGADTDLTIASASKWFYSSYFVQKTSGVLTADDIKYFNFWSGYSKFTQCAKTDTVGSCADSAVFEAANENKFFYGGGHMQKHAALNGLGAMNSAALATEIRSQVGTDIHLTYNSPQLAGGVSTSAAEYGKLLRKIIGGQLVMKSVLGTHPVCTNPTNCADAVSSPAPPGEDWHYSIGHWVEDDPTVGDGAFSSPGAFGFYPWVDATKSFYGIVAREALSGAISSVKCGRVIRKAWLTGVAQP